MKNLKSYYCTKMVMAAPMSKDEANKRGLIRDAYTEDEPGYYVRYEGGYESWSPQQVFQNGYVEVREDTTKEDKEIR